MTETEVHNINISYDETHFPTCHFIEYLKTREMREKAEEYFDLAKKSFDFKIEIKGNQGYDYDLKYIGDDKYNLSLIKK